MSAAETIVGCEAFARALEDPDTPPAASWRPLHLRLLPGEEPRFAELCGERGIERFDTIDRQLADLAATRLPAASEAERRAFVETRIAAAGERACCGNHVYLPWAARVAHILSRDDYFDVITDRNRDKITRDEQRLLRTRRIGVMGLSVGGEAALTVAQEHLCGAIVLADFDALDLSNLNRLGAGFDDLGVNKAVLVARRIARIDPYIDVTVHADGVTPANLETFLDGLDLLIEECDGLSLKYDVRQRARERKLNIVFAGDERGFLSIEPYGQWPELEPFHGRIDGPQAPREAYPDVLSFMRALTVWLGGWETISERSRGSVARIGTTLGGYPQLAGEARFAAGQIAHVARRLLLGERLPPFVGHIDLDALLPAVAADGAS